MSKTLSATEARIHLGEHLHRIDNVDVITVEHDGTPQGVVVSITEYQRLLNNNDSREDWWELAERSREAFRRQLGDCDIPSAVQLIRDGREERDAQLLDALH